MSTNVMEAPRDLELEQHWGMRRWFKSYTLVNNILLMEEIRRSTTWDVQNPVNNGIFTISTSAGLLPPTVEMKNGPGLSRCISYLKIYIGDITPSLKLTFSHLKMDGWNISFLLGNPIFRGENVSSYLKIGGYRCFQK